MAPEQTTGTIETLSPIRRVIGERMMHSLQRSAQLTTVVEVDVTRVGEERAEQQRLRGKATSFLSYFARAALDAIATNPRINSTLDDTGTRLTISHGIHLGIAVDAERGLMVPVIRDAESLDTAGLGAPISALATRVRHGGITPQELAGGTFTITNTGSRGALFDTPILNSPQTAILSVGAVGGSNPSGRTNQSGLPFTVQPRFSLPRLMGAPGRTPSLSWSPLSSQPHCRPHAALEVRKPSRATTGAVPRSVPDGIVVSNRDLAHRGATSSRQGARVSTKGERPCRRWERTREARPVRRHRQAHDNAGNPS